MGSAGFDLATGSNGKRGAVGSTVVELGAYGSKDELSDMALEVIRSVEGLFTAWDFAVWGNAQGARQEQALEFLDHLLGRGLAVKQRQQLVFEGVVGIGPIELLGFLF